LILVAGACVAGAGVAGAVVAPALDLVATGFELFVAAAVAFVVATAGEGDDEAGALDAALAPAIGPPAIFIALVAPN
jgi:hypothetical protein